MNDTLILDSNWKPSGFCHWTTAVKLIWENRATVVKEDEAGRVLHSPSFTMGLPRVIAVKNSWQRRKKQAVPLSRRNVAIRDNSTCQYCGKILQTHQYTLDHVIPRSKGGFSTWINLVLCCVRCNRHKAGLTLEESGMKLLSKPFEPKPDDPKYNFKLHINRIRPEWKDWQNWLYAEKASWAYWNVALDS
jgi:5-methylcytosine-specific restriction endonuclease McrA